MPTIKMVMTGGWFLVFDVYGIVSPTLPSGEHTKSY